MGILPEIVAFLSGFHEVTSHLFHPIFNFSSSEKPYPPKSTSNPDLREAQVLTQKLCSGQKLQNCKAERVKGRGKTLQCFLIDKQNKSQTALQLKSHLLVLSRSPRQGRLIILSHKVHNGELLPSTYSSWMMTRKSLVKCTPHLTDLADMASAICSLTKSGVSGAQTDAIHQTFFPLSKSS